MDPNLSPWLHELVRTRPIATLNGNHDTDVAIIGGGIAGITTAYFTLKETDRQVTLIEAGKVAHGATGRNAGQVVGYFERPFADLVKEFGLQMTAEAHRGVESAWSLLDGIYNELQPETPYWQTTGYAGAKDLETVMVHLENNILRIKAGLSPSIILIAGTAPFLDQIPDEYRRLYTLIPPEDILALLETKNEEFFAAMPSRKGCLNSARFTEEVAGYLLAKYVDRFTLAEHAPVITANLYEDHALLELEGGLVVSAKTVVLCTNGFERINIRNHAGDDVDSNFHHLVRGAVGYMAGYLEELNKPPAAVSYLPTADAAADPYESTPYFYLTRRPLDGVQGEEHNLVCVGGPEALMDDTTGYSHEHPYPDEAQQQIDGFLKENYKHVPDGPVPYRFRWHGLMGYTPNGLRCIGREPLNHVLYYNLGCNGVGILPSIYGGKRIGQLLAGQKLPPSVFDPKDVRNALMVMPGPAPHPEPRPAMEV